LYGWAGTVSAASGAAPNAPTVFVASHAGTVAVSGASFVPPLAVVYGNATTSRGKGYGVLRALYASQEYLDVTLRYEPARLVQVVFTAGTGQGTRNYTAMDTTAVVRGTWTLGYRHLTCPTTLSAQASALDVSNALRSLPFPELKHITVTRVAGNTLAPALQGALTAATGVAPAALGNGWAWQVTFFDAMALTHVAPVTVVGDGLYTFHTHAANDATVAVAVLPPGLGAALFKANGTAPLGPNDVPANYTAAELGGFLAFHSSAAGGRGPAVPVLGPNSVGFWASYKTLRVVPNRPAPWALQPFVGAVAVNVTMPLPTARGLVYGLELPVLRYKS